MLDIPYCGAPPIPGAAAWNLDPILLALLSIGGLAIGRLAMGRLAMGRLAMGGTARLAATGGGWLTLTLALVSPLCSLSVALFSARVGQHMLITLIAAPLLAFGLWPPAGAAQNRPNRVGLPTLGFALALWGWHLPGPYAATFASTGAYWAMHASLFGSALWLWAALRNSVGVRPEAATLAALITAVHMGMLGALLTLAPRPLFLAAHPARVTAPWGLSPLEDQQLGGLLMWAPGGVVFAAVCVAGLGLALRRPNGRATSGATP